MEKRKIEKKEALRVLEDRGSVTIQEYVTALAGEGLPIGEPQQAWNILNRLRIQGLAERSSEQGKTSYMLTTPAGKRPVERRATISYWEITKRGKGRLKWLLEHPKKGRKRG